MAPHFQKKAWPKRAAALFLASAPAFAGCAGLAPSLGGHILRKARPEKSKDRMISQDKGALERQALRAFEPRALEPRALKLRAHAFDIRSLPKDLSGRDLRRIFVRGLDLREYNFKGADMRGINAAGAKFKSGHLENASLEGGNLRGIEVEFDGRGLINTSFKKSQLERAIFRSADGDSVTAADFSGSILKGARFEKLQFLSIARAFPAAPLPVLLSGANLRKARFVHVKFIDAEARGADFRKAEFVNSEIKGGDFRGADFRGVKHLPDFDNVQIDESALFEDGMFQGRLRDFISSRKLEAKFTVNGAAAVLQNKGDRITLSLKPPPPPEALEATTLTASPLRQQLLEAPAAVDMANTLPAAAAPRPLRQQTSCPCRS